MGELGGEVENCMEPGPAVGDHLFKHYFYSHDNFLVMSLYGDLVDGKTGV